MVGAIRRVGGSGALLLLAAALVAGWAVVPAGATNNEPSRQVPATQHGKPAAKPHGKPAPKPPKSPPAHGHAGAAGHPSQPIKAGGHLGKTHGQHGPKAPHLGAAGRTAKVVTTATATTAKLPAGTARYVVRPAPHAVKPAPSTPGKTPTNKTGPTAAAPASTAVPAGTVLSTGGFVGVVGDSASSLGPSLLALRTVTGGTVDHAAGSVRPQAIVLPVAKGLYNEPMVLAAGPWRGLSMQAATNLSIPILFGAAVALFALLQALIDRRDPKLSRAPERGEDDTVGFV